MRPSPLPRWFAVCACLVALFAARQAFAQPPESDHDYRAHSALISAGTLSTIAWNATGHAPGWVGGLGFFGGALQVVYATKIRSSHATTSVFNYFIGGAAVVTSLSALSTDRRTASSGPQVRPLIAWDADLRPCAGATLTF